MPANKASKIVTTKAKFNSEEIQIENHFDNLTSIEESMQKLDLMLSGKDKASKNSYKMNIRSTKGNLNNLHTMSENFESPNSVLVNRETVSYDDHEAEIREEAFCDENLYKNYNQNQLYRNEPNESSDDMMQNPTEVNKDREYAIDENYHLESETQEENLFLRNQSKNCKEYLWSEREEEIDYDTAAKELQADLERLQKYQYKPSDSFNEERTQDVRTIIPKKTAINIDKVPVNKEINQRNEEEDQFAKLKALMARTRQDIEAFSSKIDDSS